MTKQEKEDLLKALDKLRAEAEKAVATEEPDERPNPIRYEKCPSGSCYWAVPRHGSAAHFNGAIPPHLKAK